MFVIKNLTTSDIVMDDLRVILGGGKEIDLDKVASRWQTERSTKLRKLVQQKRIKIVRKDLDDFGVAYEPEESTIKEMENRLKKEFKSALKHAVNKKAEEKDEQIIQLTNAVHALVNKLSEQASIVPQSPVAPVAPQPSNSPQHSSDGDISDDIASSIHAKAVKRMQSKVTGHVDTKSSEQNSRDDTLADNIKALEDLL